MQKLWPTVGFEAAISSFPTTVTFDTCIMQDTNNSEGFTKFARHGQNQEKEEKLRLLN